MGGQLKEAMDDLTVLDDALKQYMDGGGRSRLTDADVAPMSWRRVVNTCIRPLIPSRLRVPTPEETELSRASRSLSRLSENNTALSEAVLSKDELIRDLNSRIK
ncbi:unnamed protein product, partial [Discosporangium mesarthrocarpum]